MDKIDLGMKAYRELSAKESEYEAFIADYTRQLQIYEDERLELHQRWVDLQRLVENEQMLMKQFEEVLGDSGDDLVAHINELEGLVGESEIIYHQKIADIDNDESMTRENFQKKRLDYEDKIERLRQKYASTYQ
ncbi:hypothetical protein [Streptococcus thoraltensis]|uniref:hypothetical protein n=1 Tax=Streptococcus thoraltensis TaxID=55085 RepID=UPI00037D9AA1|nr:hypothetical protein [Streptococcus thoraltensis]